jgi:hypothetical protein
MKSSAHMEIQGTNIAIDSLIYAMLAPYEVASLTFESGSLLFRGLYIFVLFFVFFFFCCYAACRLLLK